MNKYICFSIFLFCCQIPLGKNSSNRRESYCALGNVNFLRDFAGKDIFYAKLIGLKCEITSNKFTLDPKTYAMLENKINKYQKEKENLRFVEFGHGLLSGIDCLK